MSCAFADHAGDQFYRYKMPALQSKVEGRGNGVKTNIINLVDVARALGRPPSCASLRVVVACLHPMPTVPYKYNAAQDTSCCTCSCADAVKFFSAELGAQSKFDDKSGTAIVNGAHDTSKLSHLLEGFIKRFVQCGQCKNPETDIVVTKKSGQKDVVLECNACGAKTPVDMRHKLTTYIMNNPPENSKRKEAKQMQSGDAETTELEEEERKERERKERKKEKKREKKEREADSAEDEDKKKEKRKKDKDKKEKKSKRKSEKNASGEHENAHEERENQPHDQNDNDDEGEFQTDTSKTAQEQRMNHLSSAAAKMTGVNKATQKKESKRSRKEDDSEMRHNSKYEEEETDDDGSDNVIEETEEEDEQVVELREAAASKGAQGTLEALSQMGIQRPEIEASVLVEGLLGGSSSLAARAKTVRNHFAMYAKGDATKQMQILCALELFLTETAPAQQRELPLVLKLLYDDDAFDESTIYKWFHEPKSAVMLGVSETDAQSIRSAASKFVEFLKQEEEEEEDDDDDSDKND